MTDENTTDADAATRESESAPAWGTTAFEAGGDVGLVARLTIGLIERDNPSTRERLWGLVSDDAPLDDILDELSSTGLKALPDFGLAQVEGSAVRIVARGRTTIAAELTSGSTREIDPSGVRTWIEELVHDVAAITITMPPRDGERDTPHGEAFAVLAGSVPASSLERRYDAADDHADIAESGAGWTAGRTGTRKGHSDTSVSSTEDEHGEVAGPQAAPEPESAPERVADVGRPPVAEAPAPAAPPAAPAGARPASPQPPPPGASPTSGPLPGPATGDPEPGLSPTELMPSSASSDSAGVVGDDAAARGRDSSIFDDDLDDDLGGGVDEDSDIDFGDDFDDDFDDYAAGIVTAALPGDTAASNVGSDRDVVQDDDGRTVTVSDDPPVHGVLRFSNGARVDIDRAILIGRNPKVTGAVEGSHPHIMKFEGRGQGLSRTHAEVRVEGGAVLVEDLQSTNGTEVQLPGQQRRRLRGGEPIVIVVGTLIDFGDELTCTFESAI